MKNVLSQAIPDKIFAPKFSNQIKLVQQKIKVAQQLMRELVYQVRRGMN